MHGQIEKFSDISHGLDGGGSWHAKVSRNHKMPAVAKLAHSSGFIKKPVEEFANAYSDLKKKSSAYVDACNLWGVAEDKKLCESAADLSLQLTVTEMQWLIIGLWSSTRNTSEKRRKTHTIKNKLGAYFDGQELVDEMFGKKMITQLKQATDDMLAEIA